MNVLEKKFQKDMEYICRATKEEFGQAPTRFMQMINEYGAVNAVKKLIPKEVNFSKVTEEIIMAQRPDLLAEYYVLKPEYEELFTDSERRICREHLAQLGFDGAFESGDPQ